MIKKKIAFQKKNSLFCFIANLFTYSNKIYWYIANMKELIYSLGLNIAYKNINNASFFILILKRSSENFFLSKKFFKKINIIDEKLFIHHPIYLKSFLTPKDLTSYLTDLNTDTKNLIEYLNYGSLKFHKNLHLFFLFNKIIILQDLYELLENLELFCQEYFFFKRNKIII